MEHPLDDIRVWDPEGRDVRLAELWSRQTAVLMFVRHFGCLFCREQVAGMRAHLSRIRERHAELHVIGNGSIEEARAFRDEETLDLSLFTDPTLQAYRTLAMQRGIWRTLSGAVRRAAATRGAGFRQSALAGDPWQQGGVLVIASGGQERYRFISRYAGDHPPPDQIIARL